MIDTWNVQLGRCWESAKSQTGPGWWTIVLKAVTYLVSYYRDLKKVVGNVWLNFMSFYCFRSLPFLALTLMFQPVSRLVV